MTIVKGGSARLIVLRLPRGRDDPTKLIRFKVDISGASYDAACICKDAALLPFFDLVLHSSPGPKYICTYLSTLDTGKWTTGRRGTSFGRKWNVLFSDGIK